MNLTRNHLAFMLLFSFEAVVFYTQMREQITPYYATGFDQVSYLGATNTLLRAYFTQGWPAFWSQLGVAPQGATFPVQGAVLALIGGINRTSMTSINLIYFFALQAMVFWTVLSKTGHQYLAWVSVAAILSFGSVFPVSGGIYDYRIDFSAMCLYGIWVCSLLTSNLFHDRRWSIISGLLGALLVSMRFIALPYVACVLVLLTIIVLVKDRSDLKRICNGFISGTIVLVVVVPLAYLARRAMYNYYVVGHFTGNEKDIRAAEAGVTSKLSSILYYPKSIITDQLGITTLLIFSFALLVSFAFGANRLSALRRRRGDLIVCAVSVTLPVIILSIDIGKSPVVGGIVSVPILILIALLSAPVVRRRIGAAVVALAMFLAVPTFLANATAPQHSLQKADLNSINKANAAIADYIATAGITAPMLAFDAVTDYLNAGTVALAFLQQYDIRDHDPITPGTTLGSIFAISHDEAIEAVKSSDIVVVTSQFKGRDTPYPFNASMKALWPEIASYCEANLIQLTSGTIGDRPYRVFANVSIAIDGLSGGWVTGDGINVSVDRFFIKKRPFIVLEGVAHKNWMASDPEVIAHIGGKELPVTYKSDRDRYRLVIDASDAAEGAGIASISLSFDRFFVPAEIGLNGDKRRLVFETPIVRKLETSYNR